MGKIRVRVNDAKCQSYRRCVSIAPGGFRIADSGKAAVQEGVGSPGEDLLKAARSCPYRAITAIDGDTGEQLFPPLRKPAGQ
ncbi:MAG: ferredoxin [Steroidobacteraceae bacterium]